MRRLTGLVKSGVLAAGGYRRRLRRAPFPGLATLCYHNILPDAPAARAPFRPLHLTAARFREHCRFLAGACAPVTLAALAAACSGGPPLPPRAVHLTFDDGYRNMLTVAAPILAEFRLPATFFVCPGHADGGLLWYDAAALAVGEAAVASLKALPDDERRARCAAHPRAAEICPAAATMTPDELRRLAAFPGMAIGAHTLTHPILARCSPERQRAELAGSRAALAEWLGAAPLALAYPNGRPDVDFTAETEALARAAGFALAFSTEGTFTLANAAPHRLPRFMMTDFGAAELAHRLAYSWSRA